MIEIFNNRARAVWRVNYPLFLIFSSWFLIKRSPSVFSFRGSSRRHRVWPNDVERSSTRGGPGADELDRWLSGDHFGLWSFAAVSFNGFPNDSIECMIGTIKRSLESFSFQCPPFHPLLMPAIQDVAISPFVAEKRIPLHSTTEGTWEFSTST